MIVQLADLVLSLGHRHPIARYDHNRLRLLEYVAGALDRLWFVNLRLALPLHLLDLTERTEQQRW